MSPFPDPVSLVPHARPALMIDRVIAASSQGTTCAATLHADNPYLLDGVVPAWVALELMAQCMGVHRGLRCRETGEPFGAAWLVGAPKVSWTVAALPLGKELRIEAVPFDEASPLSVFDGVVRLGDQELATARLNVFHGQPEDA